MKPIDTVFKSYRFRSRLEAKWAVFFEEMGFEWEYEPEGYELDNGVRYLPDFRIGTTWFEVKPAGIASNPKVTAFRDAGNKVVLLSGDPLDYIKANPESFITGTHASRDKRDLAAINARSARFEYER